MSERSNNFWINFEKFLNDNIPHEIIQILTKTGYDNALSMVEINEEEINEIEKSVSRNLREALKQSKHYSDLDPLEKFTFVPGHRKMILLYGRKISEFMESQKLKTQERQFNFTNAPFMMKELINSMKENENIAPNQHRYSKELQWFCTYIYMMGGKATYEVLCNNLPLPQTSTIQNYIKNRKQTIIEGELRCQELDNYLKKLNAPRKIWISEDASGVVARVTYDPKSNQLIGIVLPTNENTGMPEPFSYVPQSVKEIDDQIRENSKSTLVYLILAQPLLKNAAPFILQIFGTNNKFKTNDVLLRWRHTQDQLKRYGIEVTGISSDGDARLLTSMKNSLNALINQQSNDVLMNLHREQLVSFIQDILHWATKMRNRMLKASIHLPMGNKVVSISHLKILIETVRKEIHGVVLSDICPYDRQNFKSFQKISDDRVLDSLKNHIPDSEATILYLKLTRIATQAFTEINMTPLERVRNIWHTLFFFRAWKKWLKSTKNYTDEHFISQNAFACLELNAYGILHLIKKFRNSNESHLFIPELFSSQNCEQTFRQFRSMSTANWTKINFILCELFHMVGRIELLNEIMYSKLADLVSFPRFQSHFDQHEITQLPSDKELKETMEQALRQALLDASKFGMNITEGDIRYCELQKGNISFQRTLINESEYSQEDTDASSHGFNNTIDCTHFRKYLKKTEHIDGNSPFVEVIDEDGSTNLIKKSAIVWLVSESRENLSNDRLKRVQVQKEDESNGPKRKCKLQQLQPAKKMKFGDNFYKSNHFKIGEWCLFQKFACEPIINEGHLKNCIAGRILGFKYKTGKNEKDKQYSLNIVPISTDSLNKRGIDVLSMWYELGNDFILRSSNSSFFVDIECYLCGFTSPAIVQKSNETDMVNVFKMPGSIDELEKCLSTDLK